jgi:UPF0755 protein
VIVRLTALLLIIALLALGAFAWYANTPATPTQLPTEFTIAYGSSLRKAALKLEEKGVIRHPLAFVALVRLLGQAGKIKAGSYSLDQPLSPYQVLDKITQGDTMLTKITVIEGWTFKQMRAAIDAHPRLKHETINMSDAELLRAIGADATHPEGLFFPDTYFFDADASDLALYKRAYRILAEKLETAWQGRAAGLPYKTAYQALTLASIVEKETGAADERPLIAAVFVNRLRLGMRLQTDPSVIYGLGDRYDGNIRKTDLQSDTAYNTYTRAGLTPTPIALPSEGAIEAVMHPETSSALYFVAKGGGRHQFSNTLAEHNRAVSRYQRGGR